MESLFNKDNLNKVTEKENKILSEIPKNLTPIEKSRYIYIQLGKYFSYDKKYITTESEEEKKQNFNRDIKDVKDNKVVCTSLSKIYENMLNRVGINAKTVLIPGKRLGHAITELEIDGKKYFTDLTHDLMNIKTGLKTNEFMTGNIKDNHEYTILLENELQKIDNKIGYTYKRNVYG